MSLAWPFSFDRAAALCRYSDSAVMSGAATKATRRQLRRAMGLNSIQVLAEMQGNLERLANSLALAHDRLDRLESERKQAKDA